MAKQPKGAKMMAGGGAGHYSINAKDINMDTAGAHKGKSPAHAYKGGGSGAHGKKVVQTKNAKHEETVMSGRGEGPRQASGKAGTFMQKMVARRGY